MDSSSSPYSPCEQRLLVRVSVLLFSLLKQLKVHASAPFNARSPWTCCANNNLGAGGASWEAAAPHPSDVLLVLPGVAFFADDRGVQVLRAFVETGNHRQGSSNEVGSHSSMLLSACSPCLSPFQNCGFLGFYLLPARLPSRHVQVHQVYIRIES